MKKLGLLSLLLIMVIILTACYDAGVEMVFDTEGDIDLKIDVKGDVTASRDDINMVYWQMRTAFPEIDINYQSDRRDKDIEFERIESISHEEIEHINFAETNGSYEFEMEIPAIYSEKDDSDDLFLDITITLPENIDMANTTNVDGNEARWDIRERDLHQSIRLRAVTE